ncbi:MAG: hypothetical protein AAFO07_13460 [Bacteroidota bacterium]
MNDLNKEISYQTKDEFNSLLTLILKEVKSLKLKRYIDKSWIGREISPRTWNGEYIDENSKIIYRLEGTNYTSTNGEENYSGKWKVVREENYKNNELIRKSDYQIRTQSPGIFSHVNFTIKQTKQEKTQIQFDWSKPIKNTGQKHSQLIKSTVEYGIISAFEDIKPIDALYIVTLNQVRYHPIDTSFKLLNYVTIRNTKRAFFKEHIDLNPRIEEGEFRHKGKLVGTIIRYNN